MAKIRLHEQTHFAANCPRGRHKKYKILLFFRLPFPDLYQTLHAERGRQYNFCRKQLLLHPIPNFSRF